MVGLRDVARAAQVSIPTASRVLSGANYPVAEPLRERVLAAAQQLDYVPNRQAQALLGGNAGTVGVMVGDMADPYFGAIVRGIYDVATVESLLVTICSTLRDTTRELEYFKMLQGLRTEIVILAGSGLLDSDYQKALMSRAAGFRRAGGTLVTLGDPETTVSRVLTDNREGGRLLGRHLHALGHREVGVLAGDRRVVSTVDRIEGLRSGFPGRIHLQHGAQTREGGRSMAIDILDRHPNVTALIGTADQMALGALRLLGEQGNRVPQDYSLAGFNDIAAASDVGLTSVALPLRDMGAAAMRLALEARDGAEERVERFPVELAVRTTTGPVRSG